MSAVEGLGPSRLAAALLFAALGSAQAAPAETGECALLESGFAPEGEAGARRWALLVGVGDYRFEVNGRSIDLPGPAGDARKMGALLRDHYGYPARNVCTLLDAQATHARFDAAWDALVAGVGPGDAVVFYFAGHGSQTTDWDGPQDESDGKDETFMLHDSRVDGNLDLTDDMTNERLARLYAKTESITVIADSCNSGSATRDVGSSVRARQAVEVEVPKPDGYRPGRRSDYDPASMPGLVFLSAAKDGTTAQERGGEGLFTKALVAAVSSPDVGSYAQLVHRLPRILGSLDTAQVPQLSGELSRPVFGRGRIERPLSWSVASVEKELGELRLAGPSLPGWSTGARLGIFVGDVSVEDLQDPARRAAKRKGQVRLLSAGAFDAIAEADEALLERVSDSDAAILEEPAPIAQRDKLRLRLLDRDLPAEGELPALGALSADRRQALRTEIEASGWSKGLVDLVDSEPDFLAAAVGPDLLVYGAEGSLRGRLGPDDSKRTQAYALARNLGLFVRQRHLLRLEGAERVDEQLKLSIVADDRAGRSACPVTPFRPAGPGEAIQEIPLCTGRFLRVELADIDRGFYPDGVYVGILYLSNDGSIHAFPREGTVLLDKAGQVHDEDLFWSAPPVDAIDHVLVFGTPVPVDWSRYEVEASRGLDDSFDFADEGSVWTRSYLGLRITAAPGAWTEQERTDPQVCAERYRRWTRQRRPCP